MSSENDDVKVSASGDGNELPPPCPSPAKWTILLDIAADGLLANFAIESLKQLKRSAGSPEDNCESDRVMVAAQFAVDAPAGQRVPRYVFGPGRTGTLADCLEDYLDASRTMTEQEALVDFMDWAFQQPELKADHYALILWGHGPQLLMLPQPGPGLGSASLFLSPTELGEALRQVLKYPRKPRVNAPEMLDLIAFDACSMSMFEVAYEVKDYVKYMVASQEEVPDLSFPYDTLVQRLRDSCDDDLEGMLEQGVNDYIEEYEDYIDNAVTEMKPATLAALNLACCDELKNAVRALACALYDARDMPSLPSLLIKARQNAREFVSGLYVDILDFASALITALETGTNANLNKVRNYAPAKNGIIQSKFDCQKHRIWTACKAICKALEDQLTQEKCHLVLANRSPDETCHGVSLYMPYLSDDELALISRPMVKGGDATRGGKDFTALLNSAAPQQLLCLRRDLIADTEHYYEHLSLSHATGWYRFIVEQWTPILVNTVNEQLDVLYSAEQAARNACRGSKRPVKVDSNLCQPQGSS